MTRTTAPERVHRSSEKEMASPRKGHNAVDGSKIFLGDITAIPFQELYGVLAQRSPAEIRQLAQQLNELPSGKKTNAKIRAFFKAWAHLDPAAAFKTASKLRTAETRETAIGATISGTDSGAMGSLAQTFVSLPQTALPERERASLLAMILEKWSDFDAPAAAMFFDDAAAKGISFTLAGNVIAQNWAATDPAAALTWAKNHAEGPLGGSALSGAMRGWWERDHAAAEAYALAHANDPGAMQLVSALVDGMAKNNPQHAVAWVNQLPDATMRNQSESMLAASWATNDPRAAGEWALTLPNAHSLGSVLSYWAQTDPEAAGQWVQTLNGPARDTAIGAFSTGIVVKDPASALNWLASISDPTIKERSLRATIEQWMFRDPVAARAWVQNSSLSEAEKAKLLAQTPGQ